MQYKPDLTVSFFGRKINTPENYNGLSTLQEIKLLQNIVRTIKTVLSFDDLIIKEQDKCWISVINIPDEKQRIRIALATESVHHTPVRWINNNTIEVIIHPDKKTKKRNYFLT